MMSKVLLAAGVAIAQACDLVPELYALQRSWVIDTVNADNDPCLQAEKCLTGPGARTVLRFDSSLANQGRTDCQVGWTPSCPSYGQVPGDQFPFHFDQCHNHWHLSGFSDYALSDPADGRMIASGYKNGLCLMDVVCSRQKYTCSNQGLSAGCKDIYDKTLNCQWIDITDIDQDKEYDFTWRTNIEKTITETNYDNNIIKTKVNLATVARYRVGAGPSPNQCPRYGGVASSTRYYQNTPTYTNYNQAAAQPVYNGGNYRRGRYGN